MDRELIERLASQTGLIYDRTYSDLFRFAAMVAEECAKVALAVKDHSGVNDDGQTWLMRATKGDCAAAIREKFKCD